MILVVVDYQKDFVDGALGFAQAAELEAGIAARVEETLAAGGHVIFTLDTHDANYLNTQEGKNLPIMHCQENSPGWRLYGCLEKYMDPPHERVVLLPKYAFGAQSYDSLAELQPFHFMVVGLVTNICVITNAVLIQARFPNAKITVDSTLCASPDPSLHQKALDVMAGLQMEVV